MVLFGDGKDSVECAPDRTRHVFRADDRTVVGFQPLDALLKLFWPTVVVKRDDIRLLHLNTRNWVELFWRRPVSFPNPACKRLNGIGRASPLKNFRQQRENQLAFVLRFLCRPGRCVRIARLIPNVPGQNSRIICEGAHHSFYIGLQLRILRFVLERVGAGALHPS